MTKDIKKTMGFSPRLTRRIQQRGTRGNIIKSLAELIKNADDAYDRLELKGEQTSGIIEVAYDHLKVIKGYSIKGFFVRDFGSGMSYETVKSAYYGDENYGSDTSDETRNGAIGVGGKDCFFGMDSCFILTVCDGNITVITIETDPVTGLASEIRTGDDAQSLLEWTNKQLTRGGLESITLNKNQTLAALKIPDERMGMRVDTFIKNLRDFYTLRWILESDIRTIKLVDLTNKNTVNLQHTSITGEVVFDKSITIPHNQIPYDVHFQFNKSEEDLNHNKETGYGIIIQTGRGAILDNSMFIFSSDSAASKFFGKVIIDDWKKLYRDDNTVLTDNREGLDYENSFNKQIKRTILTNLRPLVEKERAKQGDSPELNNEIDNNIQKALNLINQIILKDPDAGLQAEDEPDSILDGLRFGLPSYTFVPEKTRKIKLYFDPGEIPTNSEITLSLNNDDVMINPPSIVQTQSSYDEFTSENKIPFVEIEITGKELVNGKSTITTLKAFFGKLQTETTIYIKSESQLQPKNGFEFKPGKISLFPKIVGGKPKFTERKIKLRIDTNLIVSGTPITISCNDDRITFSPNKLTVTTPPNAGKYLTEEIITVSGEKIGIKAKLVAETLTNNDEVRTATCDIRIEDKEPPKKFFKGYDFDKEGVPNVRSRFVRSEGIVWIHHMSPILKSVFGSDLKRINEDKELDALTLLADTIISRICYEWAKYDVEHDKVASLGTDDVPTEIERIRGQREFKYGLSLFQIIVSGKLQPIER